MRLTSFGPFAGVAAALFLLAACETAPTATGATTGTGAATTQPTTGQQQAVTTPPTRQIRPGSNEDLVVNVGDRVFFGFDKFDLMPPARATLDRQAAWLKQHPQVRLSVEGHADERGTREYNLALGERRANSVKSYLVNQGIPANRINTISYGKERPVALGSNEQAWAQNRRAVSVVAN